VGPSIKEGNNVAGRKSRKKIKQHTRDINLKNLNVKVTQYWEVK
jgi:hypothetical protein